MMQNNVKFYGKKVKDKSAMLAHESPDSVDEFKLGASSYSEMDYPAASQHFNSSLNRMY